MIVKLKTSLRPEPEQEFIELVKSWPVPADWYFRFEENKIYTVIELSCIGVEDGGHFRVTNKSRYQRKRHEVCTPDLYPTEFFEVIDAQFGSDWIFELDLKNELEPKDYTLEEFQQMGIFNYFDLCDWCLKNDEVISSRLKPFDRYIFSEELPLTQETEDAVSAYMLNIFAIEDELNAKL